MSKRKGHEYSSAMTTASSTVSVSYNDDWLETCQKLKEMRSFSMDDLLSSFDTCLSLQQDLQEDQATVLKTSQNIKNQLDNRIEMAREACKEESNDLYRMQMKLEQLQADRQALLDSLEELDSLKVETKDRILQYKEEASQYVELMDQVEAERMKQVPRLKQQISLYATTTGIKWDFDEEHLLAGQVVRTVIVCKCEWIQLKYSLIALWLSSLQAVQPKGGIRRFRIDPNEYSNFEIANHLWSLMETGTYVEFLKQE